jgi:3D-(3,5/4)-trihydroxycyclohexane-1,2-dione acylhydrolase (decyclizing)
LPGDTFADRQPDPVLQQVEMPHDYTITANDAFKAVSKYWDRIQRPEQLMEAALHAMRVLTDPAETGAVTLALPQDVQAEAYDYPARFFRKRVYSIERRIPAPTAISRAVELIKNKKRPLIVAGGGVHYSLATTALREFAEALQIPVTVTQAGKSCMIWDHKLNMGGVGSTGTTAANLLAKEADLILAVGTRLADFPTASKTAFQNEDVDIVSINVSRLDGFKMDSVCILGDAKLGLAELQVALDEVGYRATYTSEELATLKQDWNDEVDRLYTLRSDEGIVQTTALGTFNDFVGESDIIVCAAGSLPGDLHRLWRSKGIKTYHMEYGFSCMGYEIAGAFGVKLAEPDQEVYALVSDGSYMMLHSELLTSLQEGYKINVVMFDNGGFQCIKDLQQSRGSKEGFGNELRYRSAETQRLTGEYMQIDFAQMAQSIGAKAFTVRNLAELPATLRAAREEKRSTLIDIKIIPGTHSPGYESWWRVGVAEVSNNPLVLEAHKNDGTYLDQYKKK